MECETKDFNGNNCPERPYKSVLKGDEVVYLCLNCYMNYLNKTKIKDIILIK